MMMYKLLLFLRKTNEKQILSHFQEITLENLSELAGKKVLPGKIESNLLTDTKYCYVCELEVNKKEEMDKLFNTKHGKELTRDLMNYHEYVDLIFVDYNTD